MKWFIGCSGFHYTGWRGRFYPEDLPMKQWFEYYCEHFNTVELNVTFYRYPTPAMLESWYKRSPSDYKFTTKAPRLITHYKRFNDSQRLLDDFYTVVSKGLQKKLGTVLFQLPGSIAYSDAMLEKIINTLRPEFSNVLEARHRSWWNENVFNELAKKKITFCSVSHKELPADVVQNTSTIYYRLHGVPRLYQSQYRASTLKRITDEIESKKNVKEVYVYFNNDVSAAAIRNAKQVQQLVQEKQLSSAA